MSHPSAAPISTPVAGVRTTPLVTANVKTVALLFGTALLALIAYYFIGVDEGALSVFGHSAVVHEFFHDGRHFLGFPCH